MENFIAIVRVALIGGAYAFGIPHLRAFVDWTIDRADAEAFVEVFALKGDEPAAELSWMLVVAGIPDTAEFEHLDGRTSVFQDLIDSMPVEGSFAAVR